MAINWDAIEESKSGGNRLSPGVYVGRVMSATDYPEKQYVLLEFDIAEGDNANYYSNNGWSGRNYYASYKPQALGMFKHMFRSFEKSSNGLFKFDGNEHNAAQFNNLLCGIVLRIEEYDDGTEIKSPLKICALEDANEVRAGNVKPWKDKLLKKENPDDAYKPQTVSAGGITYNGDIPFTL